MRRGHVQLAIVLLSEMLVVDTATLVHFTGTIRAPMAATCIAGIRIAGLLPAPRASTEISHWFAHAALFAMVTVLLALTTRSISEALERARHEESDQAGANRGLQREIVTERVRRHPEAKVRDMSGCTADAIVRRGVLDPGIAYLPKLFTPPALADQVRWVLDEQ